MTPVDPGCRDSHTDDSRVHVTIGASQPQYLPLPTCQNMADPESPVLTEWLLTEEEIMFLTETRRLRITQLTFGQLYNPIRPEIVAPQRLT